MTFCQQSLNCMAGVIPQNPEYQPLYNGSTYRYRGGMTS
jgi:hypothetical protein